MPKMKATIAQTVKVLLFCLVSLLLVSCGGGGGGAGGGSGTSTAPTAPAIATQPQNVTVNAGQSAKFTVSASGTPSPSYQWTLDRANISGATSASYTIAAATMPQSGGSYAVVVSNSAGSVTSANAALVVNTSSTATTVAVVSSTVGSNPPTVVLPNIASVDFTGQSALLGQTVSIAQIVDTNLNALASDREIDFDVDLSDPNTIQIAVPEPPTGNLTATVYATQAITNATSSQVVTLYLYSTAGDSGDGEDTFAAFPATTDPTADTITVSIPGGYFQPAGDGTYIADLKIGVATAATSPAPVPARAIQKMMRSANRRIAAAATTTNGVSLPCPVVAETCIERSRFNPDRYLNGVFRPHYGVDFVAPIGVSIFVPAGGSPSTIAFTQTQYNACLANPTHTSCQSPLSNAQLAGMTCPSSACASVNGRAGISLTIKYVGYSIKLIHLSSIDSSMLNANGTPNTSAITLSSDPVAYTGNTGAAITGGAHLHYEVVSPTVQVCAPGATKCKFVPARTDPFPFMATQLTLAETNNQTTLTDGGQYNFELSAADYDGVSVSSAVQNAGENGGNPPVFGPQTASFIYDPTRKICLASSSPNVLQFPIPDGDTTFAGIAFGGSSSPSYCAPWGTIVAATGLANNATTTVTAEYSADATLSDSSDPLSSNSAFWTLGAQSAAGDWSGTVTGTNFGGNTFPIRVYLVLGANGSIVGGFITIYGTTSDLWIALSSWTGTSPSMATSINAYFITPGIEDDYYNVYGTLTNGGTVFTGSYVDEDFHGGFPDPFTATGTLQPQ
jgi:murein DD-endopeptidase MepM/ murein hydrolase activator NlpD